MKFLLTVLCVFSVWNSSGAQLPSATVVQQGVSAHDTLPPSAVLQSGLASLDRVRSDMGNWSDIELAAFATTAANANADCVRIEQTAHEGDEELALAKLCALGRNWDGVYSAARWYARRSAPADQALHLPVAYALLLQADLNLQAVAQAVADLAEMQQRLPFTEETDAIVQNAVEAMEVNRPDYGVQAARLYQPALLNAAAGHNASVSAGLAEAQAWHTLALLHAAGLRDEEGAEKAKLLAALGQQTTPLSTLDQYLAQQGRTRYEWLGKPWPDFTVERSTYVAAPRKKSSLAKVTLLVITGGAAAEAAALSLAVDSLRARLAPEAEARLVLTSNNADPADLHRPVVHAQMTRGQLLALLGYEAGPLFVTLNAQRQVTWLSAGAAGWLNPQQQAEVLLGRTLAEADK